MSFRSRSAKEHEKIAKKIIAKNRRSAKQLPKIPDYRGMNLVDWTLKIRRMVDGQERNITWIPFWEKIYQDNILRLMILAARQVFKTTYCTDVTGWTLTTHPGRESVYAVDNETRLEAFSKQRQRGMWMENPKLKDLIKEMSYSTVNTKLNSRLWMLTDQGGFSKVEGKSPVICIVDEGQYNEIEFLNKMEGAMSTTYGRLILSGIAGEAGSPWHLKWLETDQREWDFKYNGQYKGQANQEWRKHLKFLGKKNQMTDKIITELEDGEQLFEGTNLIVGPYLRNVLDGNWIPTVPKHGDFHGYRIPQRMMFHIPLTIVDAQQLYGVGKEFSIEYKNQKWVQSIYRTHIEVEFQRTPRRPITPEMVLNCMTPYKNMRLLQPENILELKSKYGNKITVTMGIDWGSGPSASKTVCVILIYWKDSGIYQLAHLEWRPREDQRDQPPHFVKIFRGYYCDMGIADLGYGADKIKNMQDGNYNRENGEWYDGLSLDKFIGSRTVRNPAKPYEFLDAVSDEHGDQVPQLRLDRTRIIDDFISIVKTNIKHPKYMGIPSGLRPMMIIPFAEEDQVRWLIDDWIQLTRKDLAKVEGVPIVDPRQAPAKEYNHPPDSMMACIYAMAASARHREAEWFWISA